MKQLFLLCCLLYVSMSIGQTGGSTVFGLLDLNYNARSAGLGGNFISVKDQDLNLGVTNPSLLNEKMHTGIGFNQAILAGGINYGMVAHARKLGKGILNSHIRYVNYGEFTRMDVQGNAQGTFNPFESIIGAGYGQQLNPRISVGGNINFIYSQLENYNSVGASIDMAGTYTNEEENLLVTALFKNAGTQFKGYTESGRSPLPAQLQMAISYKLPHAPFRFTLLAHHLNKWDITYTDPNLKPKIDPLTGDTIPVKYAGFGEKLARHFTYQLEIIASKNLHFRVAFDYHRRQEMKLEQRPGIAGFSFGAGMYFKRFSLDYGFMIFSRAGFNNMITLTTHFDQWRK
jgi:hypothetical protein